MNSSRLFGVSTDAAQPAVVRRSEILAGLSYALDLTEGQRPGHAVRSALIGMRLAQIIGLPVSAQEDLFYTLLMKDLGCSSNAARFAALFGHNDHDLKAAIKTINWTRALESFRYVARNVAPGRAWPTRVWHFLAVALRGPSGARDVVRTRCERGAEIATLIGLAPATVQSIRALDEHWNGRGQPYAKRGDEIPLLARIAGLAQTVDVFVTTFGVSAAYDMATARRARWFDPALVDALRAFRRDRLFWSSVTSGDHLEALARIAPSDHLADATEHDLDRIAEAFARVVDAKSPWTYRHSNGVADIAVGIARRLGYRDADVRLLRRAALLHDLGKLGVSNLILDKPGKLTADEIALVRQHPGHTAAILQRVSCFRSIVNVAAAHHERLDGGGYHLGVAAEQLPVAARILGVADVADALRASRPYRAGLETDPILEILARDRGTAFDPDCLDVVGVVLDRLPDEPALATPARIVGALAEDYTQAA